MLVQKKTLSLDECKLLIDKATPALKRHWQHRADGSAFIDERIKCERALFSSQDNPFIFDLYKKVFSSLDITILPSSLFLNVQKYIAGQNVFPHTDVNYNVNSLVYVASVLLNEDFKGGDLIAYYPTRQDPNKLPKETGSAFIMGSSVLHEVSKVAEGVRFSAQFRLTKDDFIPLEKSIL